MRLATSLAALLASATLAAPAFADGDGHSHGHDHGERRELGAHVHGHATLSLAVEGESVEMELEIPAESVVGFEYAPESDADRAAVETAMATLSDPAALFTLPEGCTVGATEVEHHVEGDHAEFHAEYAMTCTGAFEAVETTLFEAFPEIEEIEVEYATPAGQGAGELEPGEPRLAIGA